MSLASQVSALATRVATEFKTVRTEMAAISGGGSPTPVSPQPRINDWVVQSASTIAGFQPINGDLNLGYIFLPAGTYDAALFDIANAGSAGAVSKVVAYADNLNRLGTLKLDSSTIATTSTGTKLITGLSLVSPTGGMGIWAGIVTQGAPSTAVNYWGISRSPEPVVMASQPSFLWANISPAWKISGVTGAAPSTPSPTFGDSSVRLAFRRSA